MKMEAVVKGVEPRTVKEGTPDERTIYDVIDGDGVKWTAWEKPLAVLAWGLKDKRSVWTVEQKPSGKYTNRTLINIEERMGQAMGEALGNDFPESAKKTEPTFDQPGTTLTPKDSDIHRQTAAKCVAWMAASQGMTPGEFWSNVSDLARYFDTGQFPGAKGTLEDDLAAISAMPPEVQAAMDPFQPAPDDDLPF